MSDKRTETIYHQPLNEDGAGSNSNTKPDEARPLPGDVVPGD